MRTLRPCQQPLAAAISKHTQTGFGLIEVLMTLGAISVMSLAVYGLFFTSDVSAEVRKEQDSLNTLSTNIDRSFGLTGGFSGLSLQAAKEGGLLPAAYLRTGTALAGWGSGINLYANQVARPNDSFVVDYAKVPADACVRLASAMASNVYDLRIGGASVLDPEGLNPQAASRSCEGGARMEFVYYSGLSTGSAVATPGLTLPTAPPSMDPANPSTPTGPITTAPGVDDAIVLPPGTTNPGTPAPPPPVVPPAPPAGVTPVVPPPSTPPPPVVTPPGLTGCTAPAPTAGTQQVACPAGQYGLITQQRTGVYSCPEAWDAPVLTWGSWGTTSSSCAPCPGPGQETNTQWVAVSAGCPAGYTGSNTWEKEQRATRDYSYSCPAGTTALPGPSYGGWSGWSDTGATRNASNTCTAPAVQCDYKSRTDRGPVVSLNPLPWTPLRACDASTIGMKAQAAIVSCGGAGCGGTYRSMECTAGGWHVVAGAGSVPYVGWSVANPEPKVWSDLSAQGNADWLQQTQEAGGVTGLVSRAWTTYSCPPY